MDFWNLGGMVFYQVFLLSKSQVQAVEISGMKEKS